MAGVILVLFVICPRHLEFLRTAPVHVLQLAADESFIHLYPAAFIASQLGTKVFGLQGQPQTLQDEPCTLLSDTEIAGEFVAGDAVLAVHQEPQSGEPLGQGDR